MKNWNKYYVNINKVVRKKIKILLYYQMILYLINNFKLKLNLTKNKN